MKIHIILVAGLVALGACSSADDTSSSSTDGAEPLDGVVADPSDPSTDVVETTLPPAIAAIELPIGLDEFTAQAEALGYEVRVASEDGELLSLTEDFSLERVNVAVQDGQVVEISFVG
ncbi:MAG: hypothetical protein CSA55_02865 [Ilumatobacter coccineus]|uniref:PASTA domain-containing protein n=1 Tax=Ilumatobacter coccineus TaxID=467094 RepID=A0A2G6KAW0_9ACTN|nr:MAG: hypothetical protein CSA55_02865 [Ilumatobacter coccineus]